ncbi:DUF6197 family protein [Streptomyces sp. ScaeMP-e48]|uniref:DUF6197 family protein n=1 Tax=Streptomyces sp. ScaeMP-e48 TaxID=1100823 RepID=UPI001F4E70B7|nr:hypothetical protein [Streptomyces sp. ScaeMP-e48]
MDVPIPRPTTVPAVFRAAARLLAANGHHQGDYLPDPFNRRLKTPDAERPLSIVAAIRCVVTGVPRRFDPLAEEAIAVLAGRLEVDGEPAWNDEPDNLAIHVAAWGDVEGRTTECAVAVLYAAADATAVSL